MMGSSSAVIGNCDRNKDGSSSSSSSCSEHRNEEVNEDGIAASRKRRRKNWEVRSFQHHSTNDQSVLIDHQPRNTNELLNQMHFSGRSSSDSNSSIASSQIISRVEEMERAMSSNQVDHAKQNSEEVPHGSAFEYKMDEESDVREGSSTSKYSNESGHRALVSQISTSDLDHHHLSEVYDGYDSYDESLSNEPHHSCDEESTTSESSVLAGGYSFSAQELEVLKEFERVREELMICEQGGMSEQNTSKILQAKNINSKFTREQIINLLVRRANITKHFGYMCPKEHVPVYGKSLEERICPSPKCTLLISKSNRYWYRLVSEMLIALCHEKHTFEAILNGCIKARDAIIMQQDDTMRDYYDASLFKRMHGEKMKVFNEKREIIVFLKFSSDGFKVCETSDGEKNIWPLVFIIMNYPPRQRSQAIEALLPSFIPGTHDSEMFDLFLLPIMKDIEKLQEGMAVTCHDGKIRKLRAYILFISADWPAMSKLTGYSYHSAYHPCRMCMKKGTFNSGIRSMTFIPCGTRNDRDRVVAGDRHYIERWKRQECPRPRTDRGTRSVWAKLERLQQNGANKSAIERVVRDEGIRVRPVMSSLYLDFVFGVPYDFMHQILIGMVEQTLRLLTGTHLKCRSLNCSYVLPSVKLDAINLTLSNSSASIPSSWGRRPKSLIHLRKYKAEELKLFALYYGICLFSDGFVSPKVSRMWTILTEIVFIATNREPKISDICFLNNLTTQFHAIFAKIFGLSDRHAFCFTPTSHTLFHFSEIMRECGPFWNVSQFIVEWVAQELGELVKYRYKAEANLFHKTHNLLSMRLFGGGFFEIRKSNEVKSPGEAKKTFEAKDELQFSPSRNIIQQIMSYLHNESSLPESLNDVDLSNLEIRSFNRLNVLHSNELCEDPIEYETRTNFKRRLRNDSHSRQKFCIAATFSSPVESYHGSTPNDNSDSDISFNPDELPSTIDVYYGDIESIFTIQLRNTEQSTDSSKRFLVQIRWHYNLRRDAIARGVFQRNSGNEYSRSLTTVECARCITRPIGYINHNSKKYFLDPQWRVSIEDRYCKLKGFA